MKTIAFDFDGVMVDSVHECVTISMMAYEALGWTLKNMKKIREQMIQARPLVKNPEDFLTILNALREGIDLSHISLQEFKKLSEHTDGEKFTEFFYANRQEMMDNNVDQWVSENPLFPGMKTVFQAAQETYNVVIATTKNKNAVRVLLSKNNIHIPDKKIISREFSHDKINQLKHIMCEWDTTAEDVLFIEDVYEWLQYVSPLGVNRALVKWGYGRPQEYERAKTEGIPVLETPEELGKLIQSF